MVSLDDKQKPSLLSQIFHALTCRRDFLRKRFIVRCGLLLLGLFIFLRLFGKSGINVDIQFGEPDHTHESFFEYKRDNNRQENINNEAYQKKIERRAQDEMLQNLGGLQPPKKDNAIVKAIEPVIPKEPEKVAPVEPEFVHAFVGKTKLPPVYLDFVDLNQPWDKAQEESLKKDWKMNKYLSDRTPLNRDTADGRHPTCSERLFQKNLPTASVVLVFYNEALSVVLRTALTVLKESDPRLIHEILLYDDCSTIDELKAPLERMIASYPKIRLVRAAERGGLVRARLYSSRAARGEVLLFLDAHCEPTPGWLEPLLEPIAKDRTAVTMPSLDVIDWQTLQYSGADTIWVIGGVNWLINMLWAPIPKRERERRQKEDPYPITANLKTASMAGGLFAMDRLYFKELGEYDEGMGVWGGENMELSFRVWMCGGSMHFVPCSKVGHIFRPSHPYDFMGNNGDVVRKNYIRTARVWFDEELDFFFKIRPQFAEVDVGDLSDRLALRERLNCKSFAWFIRNVYPELPLQRDMVGAGEFKTGEGRCMDTRGGDLRQGGVLYLGTCNDGGGRNQNSNKFMMLTKDNNLMGLNFCADSGFSEELQFHICHDQGGAQAFKYDPVTKRIHQDGGKKCVTGDIGKGKVITADCKDGDKSQSWEFEYKY